MKYKIGQPVIAIDVSVHQAGRKETAIIGGIIKIQNFEHDLPMFYVLWADGEEVWYNESDIELYAEQARIGKKIDNIWTHRAAHFNLQR